MNILFASSLVSIVTLIILLFNRSTPRDLRIPSAFLGGVKLTAPRRLSLTRPPFLLWFCVIVATLGAVAAYWPPSKEGRGEVQAQSVVVWVDDSLSAAISRAQHPDALEGMASDIAALGRNVFGLRGHLQGKTDHFGISYSLLPLNTVEDIEKFLNDESQRSPSAFARPLVPEEVARALSVNAEFSNSKALLAVVSDAQRATLQGLSPLKSSFVASKLFLLPEPDLSSLNREELVPTELLNSWNVAPQAFSSDSETAAFSVLGASENRIPKHARPSLFRETYGTKDESDRSLEVIVRQHKGVSSFPLVTACAKDLPGLPEFDGFGDLRSLLLFFSASFRVDDCVEETAATRFMEREPWRFRQRSIWLVPLRDDVVAAFASGRFWIPRGFVRDGDAIVYVAPSQKNLGKVKFLSEALVQLVEGGQPVAVYLSPFPPQGVLTLSGETTEHAELLPATVAPDKTVLAFQAKGLPIFYLRTTLAMPNGELTRSASWPKFWMSVAAAMGEGGGALNSVREVEASDFYAVKGKKNSVDFSRFSLRLSSSKLTWEEGWLENDTPRAGIYLSPATNSYLLLDVPAEEMANDFVSAAEFERSWIDSDSPVGDRERIQKERRLLPFVGALFAAIALFVLWSAKRRTVLSVIPLFFVILASSKAEAQNFGTRTFVQVETVPFRIMWCKNDVPPRIVSRYSELRDLLARRGTIRLAKNILGGQCKAGNAEFWWTDDPSTLNIDDVRVHISGGGFLLVEGYAGREVPSQYRSLENVSVGLRWENPPKRGMFYRSFYLLHSFDGCSEEKTMVLQLRKKVNASAPSAMFTGARFLSAGDDCFGNNEDYRTRSFVNMMYAALTTDYKEDHMRLPELLDRVRNLGLEP